MNNVENKELDKKIQLSDEELKNVTGGAGNLTEFCRLRETEEDCLSKSNGKCYWHPYGKRCLVRGVV